MGIDSNVDHIHPDKYPSHEEAKELILDVGRRLYAKGFVASNDGNITCRVSEHEVWGTPTGVSKGFMTEDMLILLDIFTGEVLSGNRKPSSEIKMHLRVYKENPETGGVVHAHPFYATCASAYGMSLNGKAFTEILMGLGEVPLAPFAMPGTDEVPESIAPFCKDYHGVLLAHHGATTWAKNLLQAYMFMESLEFYAHTSLMEKMLPGGFNQIPDSGLDGLDEIKKRLGF